MSTAARHLAHKGLKAGALRECRPKNIKHIIFGILHCCYNWHALVQASSSCPDIPGAKQVSMFSTFTAMMWNLSGRHGLEMGSSATASPLSSQFTPHGSRRRGLSPTTKPPNQQKTTPALKKNVFGDRPYPVGDVPLAMVAT